MKNKKGQIPPKLISVLIGFIAGWILVGKIKPEFAVVGGIIGGIIAYRIL